MVRCTAMHGQQQGGADFERSASAHAQGLTSIAAFAKVRQPTGSPIMQEQASCEHCHASLWAWTPRTSWTSAIQSEQSAAEYGTLIRGRAMHGLDTGSSNDGQQDPMLFPLAVCYRRMDCAVFWEVRTHTLQPEAYHSTAHELFVITYLLTVFGL